MMAGMTQSTATLYGIRNCDTVKKARLWLTERAVDHVFHDFKRMGVPTARLDQWLKIVPWETLLNRQGTTWRKLDDATRNSVSDAASARAVMLTHPSAIKRPVMEWSDEASRNVTVGFKPQAWSALLDERP
jgi:arsenate reductase